MLCLWQPGGPGSGNHSPVRVSGNQEGKYPETSASSVLQLLFACCCRTSFATQSALDTNTGLHAQAWLRHALMLETPSMGPQDILGIPVQILCLTTGSCRGLRTWPRGHFVGRSFTARKLMCSLRQNDASGLGKACSYCGWAKAVSHHLRNP